MAAPVLQSALALALLVAAGACARETPRPGSDKPVLDVGGQAVYLDELQQYLADTLGEGEEAEGEEPVQNDPGMLSRLFDQFVEEQLLLQEARKQGVQVSDAEVQVYLQSQGLAETTPEESERPEARASADRFQSRVRSSLLVKKFKDQTILKDLRVTPDEIEKHFHERPTGFQSASRVVLRQILVDEEPLARKLRGELEQGASFQKLAETHSLAPDRGEARQYEEGDLPEEMQAVIAALKEGETSGVVNVGGRYIILRLEARQEKTLQALDDVRERIESMLLRQKSDEVMARYLSDLRARVPLRIYYENLPFPYQAETRS